MTELLALLPTSKPAMDLLVTFPFISPIDILKNKYLRVYNLYSFVEDIQHKTQNFNEKIYIFKY